MKKKYLLFLIISLLTIVGSSVFFVGVSQAQTPVVSEDDLQNQAFVEGAGFNVDSTTGQPKDPRLIISSGIKVALSLLGILFTAYLIYGGYLILMARGEEDKFTKGKKVIFTSIIGLIIIMSAYAITGMIFTIATGNAENTGSKDLEFSVQPEPEPIPDPFR